MPQLLRHVGERAVVVVAVKMVLAADAAVRHIDIGPAVAIEIDDGNRCAHRRHFRHDAIEFVIEDGSLVNKVDARLAGHLLEAKAITSQSRLAVDLGCNWPRLGVGEMADHPGRGQHADEHDEENDASDCEAFHRGGPCLRASLKFIVEGIAEGFRRDIARLPDQPVLRVPAINPFALQRPRRCVVPGFARGTAAAALLRRMWSCNRRP